MSGGEWAFVAFFRGERKPIVRAQITHARALGELDFWRKQASTMAVVRSGELYDILGSE